MKDFDEFVQLLYSEKNLEAHDAALQEAERKALEIGGDNARIAGALAGFYAREMCLQMLRTYHEWVSG